MNKLRLIMALVRYLMIVFQKFEKSPMMNYYLFFIMIIELSTTYVKRTFQLYCNDIWHILFFFSSPHHGRPVHHSSPHQASPVHISSPHYSPPVHNSSPQRSPQHNSFQGRFQNPHSSGKVIIHKSCGGVSLKPVCCKKQRKKFQLRNWFGE